MLRTGDASVQLAVPVAVQPVRRRVAHELGPGAAGRRQLPNDAARQSPPLLRMGPRPGTPTKRRTIKHDEHVLTAVESIFWGDVQ